MKVNCCDPQIIINPLAVELITRYGNYTINGERFTSPRANRNLYVYDKTQIHPKRNNIVESQLGDCYITDDSAGENYPLYLCVPCGKCEVCKTKKINSFVQRCELESQLYDYKPIFLTLTYDEKNKPKTGVNVRDVQLYLKRLRINLERCGYREKIRYVFVGEYGRNTHRPHYHAILWNLGQSSLVEFMEIREHLAKSWNQGFVLSRFIEPSNNKSFYYTAKYLRKDCFVPDGCNPTFVCSSNRGGGIGSAFIDSLVPSIIRSLDTCPKFVNKWNGQVKDLILSKYVLDRMMPTISKSIPSVVKNSLRSLNVCYMNLKTRNHPCINLFDKHYEEFNNLFGQYLYCPSISAEDLRKAPAVFYRPDEECIREILQADFILETWSQKGDCYFRRAFDLDRKRVLYLSKLFLNMVEPNIETISHRKYLALKSFAAAAAREIL